MSKPRPPWESLVAIREAMGMSRSELARRAGMNLSHLGALESGKVSARAETIKCIAEALGVTSAAIPPPGDMSWMEKLVRERVDAELRRVGLSELATPTPRVTATGIERELSRVGGNLATRTFLQEVARIKRMEATTDDIRHVLSVITDAETYLNQYLDAHS